MKEELAFSRKTHFKYVFNLDLWLQGYIGYLSTLCNQHTPPVKKMKLELVF